MTQSTKRESQGRGRQAALPLLSQHGQARLQRLRRSDCLPAVPSAQPMQAGGQAMVEYLVITGILLASLAILTLFLETFKDYGWRILDMVASDYP